MTPDERDPELGRPTQDERKARTLAIRVVSGVVGIALVVGIVLAGLWPFTVFVALVAGMAAAELCRASRGAGVRPNEVLAVAAAAALPVVCAVGDGGGRALVLALAAIAAGLWLLAGRDATLEGSAMTVFAYTYAGLLLSYLVLIRTLDGGVVFVLTAFVGTWVADTAAYAVGMTLGRNKLWPAVSPNKTWEGTVGGVVVTVALFAGATFLVQLSVWQRAAVGLAIALAAVAGDLVESRIKRELEVKDTGRLIPGHGGVLDRFDSILFVAPTVYALLRLWGQGIWAG
jgi:phosphatidate cytidylyltransferase